MERDHVVLLTLKKAKLSKLEDDPQSIYAHALVQYGVDKEPADLVKLFAQSDVRNAIEREPDALPKILESHLHQNRELKGLKVFPSVERLQEEVDAFLEIHQTIQKRAADPFFLKQFNKLHEGILMLIEQNKKNSFAYQIEQYLEERIKYFDKKYLQDSFL